MDTMRPLQPSGWNKLGNLIWFIVKWGLIAWFAYWLLWGVIVYSLFKGVMNEANTPEGQQIIEDNGYNHIGPDGMLDPEWVKRQEQKRKASEPTKDFAPSGGSDYTGECDPNDPTDPRCLPSAEGAAPVGPASPSEQQ